MPFHFKNFSIFDDNCIHKIGTDGVLLGACINSKSPKKILDIGTGSGLIAILTSIKFNTLVDGVEIDKNSANQAEFNVVYNNLNHQIKIYNSSIQYYANTCNEKYDLIISNPPFFNNSLKSPHHNKNIAKHTSLLSYGALLNSVIKLSNANLNFWIILPAIESIIFEKLASQNSLYLNFSVKIFPNPKKNYNRRIMMFSFESNQLIETEIYIRKEDNTFDEKYIDLTKDLYLSF